MNDDVKKVFEAEKNPWWIGTCGDEPNVVPIGFKKITDDGKLAIGAVLLETTLENLKVNPRIAISTCVGAEAYQVKGTAELVTSGPVYDYFAELAEKSFHGALPAKCAIVVTPDCLIVASPNQDNRKELPL